MNAMKVLVERLANSIGDSESSADDGEIFNVYAGDLVEILNEMLSKELPPHWDVEFCTASGLQGMATSFSIVGHHTFKVEGIDSDGCRVSEEFIFVPENSDCSCQYSDFPGKAILPDNLIDIITEVAERHSVVSDEVGRKAMFEHMAIAQKWFGMSTNHIKIGHFYRILAKGGVPHKNTAILITKCSEHPKTGLPIYGGYACDADEVGPVEISHYQIGEEIPFDEIPTL